MKFAIYGSGGAGREILALARQSIQNASFLGWYDDTKSIGTEISGGKVLGGINQLNECKEVINVFIAIGDSKQKMKLIQKITNKNIEFPNLIHPSVDVFDYQNLILGKGNIIQKGCSLTCDIRIGDFVFLNLHTTIGHDVVIENFVSTMPSVNISGNCNLGEASYFGTQSLSLPSVNIARETIIGAGACVTKNTEEGKTYVGIPAKPLSR